MDAKRHALWRFRAFRCVRGVSVYLRSTTTLDYLRKDAAARSARLSKPQGKASRLDELRRTRGVHCALTKCAPLLNCADLHAEVAAWVYGSV